MAESRDSTAHSWVEAWLPRSSSVLRGRDSCGGHPPRGEGRAHQYQAPFLRLRERRVVSVTSPFPLLVSKGPDSPTLSAASCGLRALQGALTTSAFLCLSPRAMSHVCLVLAIVVRVSSPHHAHVCTRPGARLASRYVQTPTCPLCSGDQPWGPCPSCVRL